MTQTLHGILSQKGNMQLCPIALVEREGKVLTGLRNYTKDKWKDVSVWTIPGGRCDEGETVEETLRREILEEVGVSEVEIVEYIGEAKGAKEGDTVLLFYCTTTQDATCMEPEKFSEWTWIPIEEYILNEKYSGFNPVARSMLVSYLRKK